MSAIEDCRISYEAMSNPMLSLHQVEAKGNGILIEVLYGIREKVTWKELGFTADDVAHKMRLAKARDAKERFNRMQQYNTWSIREIVSFGRGICHDVWYGSLTWRELGFTADDVAERLSTAKHNIVERDPNTASWIWGSRFSL